MLNDSVPAECLVKVVHRRSREIRYEKTQSLPQATPEVVLRSAWQAQHQGTARPVAAPATITPRVDARFQGVPPEELQQGGEESRERCIARLVQAIM